MSASGPRTVRATVSESLWFVDVGFACYGIVVVDGRITAAPPIARWAIGQPLASMRRYVNARGGRLARIAP